MDEELVRRLLRAQGDENAKSSDDDSVRAVELETLFATFLPDATTEEVRQIASIQDDLHRTHLKLEGLLDNGIVNENEYARALNVETNWAMRQCSRVLGPDRCQKLFGDDALDDASTIINQDERILNADPTTALANMVARVNTILEEMRHLRDKLDSQNADLRREVNAFRTPRPIGSESAAIRKVMAQVEQVAPTPATVLILGESGTGKEVIAQTIHDLSPRRERPMISVRCGAVPFFLIEGELFGLERGANTGLPEHGIGLVEKADRSTLFLDEIDRLPMEGQVKLLRVLQEHVIDRLGSNQATKVDVRIIAATNRDLKDAVRHKVFGEELYYRLNVFPIVVPPLRERVEDIPALVWSFVDEFSRAFGKKIDSISSESLFALQSHPWPGNIRQLRNVIERAVLVATDNKLIVTVPQLDKRTRGRGVMTPTELEIESIESVLESTNWRVRGRGGAAERLGVKPTTLETRMRKLGIRARRAAGG